MHAIEIGKGKSHHRHRFRAVKVENSENWSQIFSFLRKIRLDFFLATNRCAEILHFSGSIMAQQPCSMWYDGEANHVYSTIRSIQVNAKPFQKHSNRSAIWFNFSLNSTNGKKSTAMNAMLFTSNRDKSCRCWYCFYSNLISFVGLLSTHTHTHTHDTCSHYRFGCCCRARI